MFCTTQNSPVVVDFLVVLLLLLLCIVFHDETYGLNGLSNRPRPLMLLQ
jgi:hypothetical protein